MSDWVDRVIIESQELEDRIDKLDDFLHSDNFSVLSGAHKELLHLQYDSMWTYFRLLKARLKLEGISNE